MKIILLLAATILCFTNLINAQAGQLDTSFGSNGVIKTDLGDSYTLGKPGVRQVLSLPDGSFYVIQLTGYEENGYLSKRHANGSIDSSFGTNGFVANDIIPYQMAIEPDGKIVVAYQTGLIRYNTDGSADSSFLKSVINDYFYALAIQKDGKIIVAGSDYISRYNMDGSPDTSFSGGKVTINYEHDYISNSLYINSAAIQSDGKIVVAGSLEVGIYAIDNFAILRYNENGSVDSSFSSDGIQTTGFGENRAYLYAAAIQRDGKIVVSGAIGNYKPVFALARYNTDGSPDKSFSGDGKLVTDYSTSYGGQSIAFQSDGKIVTSSARTLVRFNTNGSQDNTIFQNGNFNINSIALQSGGKILAGGDAGRSNFALARYNTNGNLDNTFIGNGIITDTARDENTGYKKIAVQKDGKIVAAGNYWNGKKFDLLIARYKTDGSADNTFGEDGLQTTYFASDSVKALAIQTDGKILVAGERNLARFNADGSLDKTFSGDGKQSTDAVYISTMSVQSDGKIVVGGIDNYFVYNQYYQTYFTVVRFNADGSTDSTFGINGRHMFVFDVVAPYQTASSLVIQNDGKIVIAGVFNEYRPYVVVARLNSNGSADTTYHGTGTKVYDNASSFGLVKLNDDKILLSVTVSYNYLINRLNTKGYVDNSFKTIELASPVHAHIGSMALQNDGKIILLVREDSLLRLNTNGTLDSTFDGNGTQSPLFAINSMVISNNKLYIAGGDRYGTIARYQLDNNNTFPTVKLTAPTNNATFLAPAAHIKLSAAASDSDGTITKVEFYNGNKLLHTETVIPYGYNWRNVPLGNYALTAKAYDNSGNVTTSAAVHISVVPNKAPVVSIVNPANNQSYTAPAAIHFEAAASDSHGRITRVEFYKDSTLLRTEYKYPYTYNWADVPAGAYTITAKATDNWGAQTTSASVTVTVTAHGSIVSNRPYSKNEKAALNDALSLRLSPNPASNIVNISASGLQANKPATISIISLSGNVLKTMRISDAATQLDVSTLASGVYTIKIVSGHKTLYKQFVKL